MLPPKGHEANPTEFFQAVMQEDVQKWQAPGRPTHEYGQMNFREAQKTISDVLGRLRFNIAAFRGWYDARASGRHLQNRWKSDPVARQVSRKRMSEESFTFQWPTKL